MELLNKIQQTLVAPKNKENTFGKFKYRSCEDILEAVKPLLGTATLTLTDELVYLGDRYYVKATAQLNPGKDPPSGCVTVSAYAREPEIQKGMNDSQITGSASSYARKYALSGLFCIDDAKDVDHIDNDGTAGPPPPSGKAKKTLNAVYDNLLDSVPDGRFLVLDKIGPVIYAQTGRYPEDINKATTIAAWLISMGAMDKITEAKEKE